MPSERQLHRIALGDVPRHPGFGPPRSGRLSDLMMYRGEQQAEAARQQGDIWGNAIQTIGATVSGGIQQHAEEQKLKKRDAAWLSFVNEGSWSADPKLALAKSIEVWGPQEGPKQFQALAAASQLAQPKRNPEADQKALGLVGGAYLKLSPEARAHMYPQIRALASGAMPEFGKQMPEKYDPDFDESVVTPFVQSMQPKAEAFTLSPGQARYEGDKKVAEAPPEPPKAPEPRVVGRSLVGQDGKVIYRDPDPPRAPRAPNLEKIETVDEQGRAVTKYVTPTAGATYAKPTGAAKPASGQQRKALSFFNRGKEADEIAAALEEGDKISPTALKYMPEIGNFLLSDSDQAYKQAQRAFTESRLRKESGATIKDEEYDNDAITYFPQPGDSAATKAQKRSMRKAVLAGIGQESGDALREFYGDEAEGMVESYRKAGQASRPGQDAPASARGPASVKTKADYDALPSGAAYIAPDGSRRRKP